MRSTRGFHTCWAMLVVVSCVFAKGAAAEEPEVVEGVVVSASADEVIIDLGTSRGVPPGATVTIFRRVEVQHPVTKKTLVDRFPVGALRLTQVSELLAIAKPSSALTRPAAIGDYAVYQPPAPAPVVEEPDEPVEPDKPAEVAGDPARESLDKAFAQTLGRRLDERVAIWSAWLRQHPNSRYANEVAKEVAWLRDRVAEMRSPDVVPLATRDKPIVAYVAAPERVTSGDPVTIAAALANIDDVVTVRVLLRRKGDVQYDTVEMRRNGDHFYRYDLNAAQRGAGNTIQYFVEAVSEDGALRPLRGSAVTPRQIEIIEPVHDPAPTTQRSEARTFVDYVDFKTGAGEDHYLRVEADYRYTVDTFLLRSFAVGVGVFDGVGGTTADVESGNTRRLATNYGFAEAEIGLHEYVGVSARFLLGVLSAGEQGALDDENFGFRSELRLGRARGTKLLLGGSLTDNIGNEAWVELDLRAIDKVPMSGTATVTNLPVGGDLGVSLNYGIGYELVSWFVPSLRVGWNARTINHTGVTVGLGTALVW